MAAAFVHPTAQVHASAVLGEDAKVWNWVQIRERARIGRNVVLSKGVYVDFDVQIGDNCKVQNHVSVFHGVTLGKGVFVGPHVCFTNDKVPRAVNPDGSQKAADDWIVGPIRVDDGASIGANATILPGVTIGRFAMIGSGSVVTRDVPAFGLVVGNPARQIASVCYCGNRFTGTACATCGFAGPGGPDSAG
jgi:UDP-2-acetamido-3-amino-2,3-dideoxy-glucuronate N-acetyltransferase